MRQMLSLHQRVYPKHGILGWYMTGTTIDEEFVWIHEFFQGEIAQPLLLLVDTFATSQELAIKTFVG